MTVERTSSPTAPSQPLEQQVRDHPQRFRVLTGDRPTGPLHLGHYFGTLANRVRLQRAGVEVFLVIADYQVITDRDDVGDLSASVREVVSDYLAAGIDPARATIFTHSAVPALNQLVVPFLSLVTVAELGRNPTVKAEADATRARRGMSGLLFTYPVHQAADILFCHGNLVPVGRDQLPHLELTRLIARRFNERYAAGTTVFREPDALLSAAPVLLGTDGTKMSKSRARTLPYIDQDKFSLTGNWGWKVPGRYPMTQEQRSSPGTATGTVAADGNSVTLSWPRSPCADAGNSIVFRRQ